MAVPYRGQGTGIMIGLEVTPGTAVSRTRSVFVNSSTLTQSARQRAPRARLSHSTAGFVKSEYVQQVDVGGAVTVPGAYSSLGLLLRAALGTVSGTGPFTFAGSASLPSLTIEQIVGTSGRSEVFAGCKVNTMTLTSSPGAEVLFAFDIIGMSKAADGSAGSPSYGSPVAMEHYECEVTWGGSSLGVVKSVSSVLNNNLTRRRGVGDLNSLEPSISAARRVVTTLVVEKDSFSPRSAEVADTLGDLVLTYTDTATGAKTLVYTIPDCRAKVDETIGANFGDLETTVTLESNGDPTIVLTNGEASYDV